jgi:predicted ABC-type ATPase
VPVKELFVVAGPNGSGKTTFAEEFIRQRPCRYLSADLIAAQLAPSDPTSARVPAGREFLRRMKSALTAEESVLVESTLSGMGFQRTLEQARLSGFETTLMLLYLDSADTCVLRVKQRARKGGHDVPEVDIRRRFSRSLVNFWQRYRRIVDRWLLMYTGNDRPQDVAKGSDDAVSIWDDGLFRRFLALVGADIDA